MFILYFEFKFNSTSFCCSKCFSFGHLSVLSIESYFPLHIPTNVHIFDSFLFWFGFSAFFLALSDVPISLCVFLALVLESAICLGSAGFFH